VVARRVLQQLGHAKTRLGPPAQADIAGKVSQQVLIEGYHTLIKERRPKSNSGTLRIHGQGRTTKRPDSASKCDVRAFFSLLLGMVKNPQISFPSPSGCPTGFGKVAAK